VLSLALGGEHAAEEHRERDVQQRDELRASNPTSPAIRRAYRPRRRYARRAAASDTTGAPSRASALAVAQRVHY